ncbi:EamA family transporter [Oceanitalea stevensii]|uniref:EamA family transporter n=1 Tax=Oceanitalea stevensii TaxID=2763072 RepID=A0ABR8Z1F8_9MICO|nr:EamA family transporter [Oceanitalea stevensii]MBD8062085.1 EamA family transporter [Oceanitalea stevensii]
MSESRGPLVPGPAAPLVLGAAVSVQFGSAVAALVFPAAGPSGVVALRLAFAALILLAVLRPSLRGRTRRDWALVVAFGLALVAMNSLLYHAIDRIPLGPAVTLEVLGPLTLYVVLGRRLRNVLWAVLALVGVAVLGGGSVTGLDPVGVLLALGAATAWAAYVAVGARVARAFTGAQGLALALAVGAVVAVPLGMGTAGGALLDPRVLAFGAAVALLSSVIPYSLEMAAMRRVTAGSFAVMMSLYPVIAALAGWLVLGQRLGWLELVGIALVCVATAGATSGARAVTPRPSEDGSAVPPAAG